MALFNKLDIRTIVGKTLLLSLLLGMAACAPKKSRETPAHESPGGPVIVDGTESSGGGEPIFPTEAEVLEILQPYEGQYQDMPPMSTTIPIVGKARHVMLMFRYVRKVIINKPESLLLDEIAENLAKLGLGSASNVVHEMSITPKLIIDKEKPCYDKFDGNKPKTMAVSDFSVDASICVSVPMLKKIPKAKLLYEAAALLLHEAAHQLGKTEEQAAAVQKYIVYELDWLMRGRFGLHEMIQESNKSITSYVDRLKEVDQLSQKPNFSNEDRIRIATLVAQLTNNGDHVFEVASRMSWEASYSRGSATLIRHDKAEKNCDAFTYTRFCGEEPFVALGTLFKSLEDKLTAVTPQELAVVVKDVRLNLKAVSKMLGPYFPENIDLRTLATNRDPSIIRMTCEVNLYDINADVNKSEPLVSQEFVLTNVFTTAFLSQVGFSKDLRMELQMIWESAKESTDYRHSKFSLQLYDSTQTVLQYKYEPELGIKKDRASKIDRTLDGKYMYKITCDYNGDD